MIDGVTKGFRKSLELQGVGYRVNKAGNDLNLPLGYSHPVVYAAPQGITFTVEGTNKMHVEGIDKQRVGQVAAEIRDLRPPEPYKGKGHPLRGRSRAEEARQSRQGRQEVMQGATNADLAYRAALETPRARSQKVTGTRRASAAVDLPQPASHLRVRRRRRAGPHARRRVDARRRVSAGGSARARTSKRPKGRLGDRRARESQGIDAVVFDRRVTSITAASRRSPRRRAAPDWSSNV